MKNAWLDSIYAKAVNECANKIKDSLNLVEHIRFLQWCHESEITKNLRMLHNILLIDKRLHLHWHKGIAIATIKSALRVDGLFDHWVFIDGEWEPISWKKLMILNYKSNLDDLVFAIATLWLFNYNANP